MNPYPHTPIPPYPHTPIPPYPHTPIPPYLTLLFLALLLTSCRPSEPDSDRYQQAMTAFYTAVASVQSGGDLGAEENLLEVTRIAPAEPAAWYNLGLLALRQNQFDVAAERLQKAAELAPENGSIQRLIGAMEIANGNVDAGIVHLRNAIEKNPNDVKAIYALAQELKNTGDPSVLPEAASLLDSLVVLRPENVVNLIERVRLAALGEDSDALASTFQDLSVYSVDWPAETQEPFEALDAAVERGDASQAQVQLSFLRNLLLGTYSFRQDLQEVQTPIEEVGDLMTRFIRLPSPSPEPSPADLEISFTSELISGEGSARQVYAYALDGEGAPDIVTAGPDFLAVNETRFDWDAPAGDAFGVAMIDYNYDFSVDVVYAGQDGIQFFERDTTGIVTESNAVEMFGKAAQASYSNVWAVDIDLEGDLDLLLASPGQSPTIFRNNGDGTFSTLDLFAEVTQLHDFAWADFDGDGDPDPALLDTRGELYLYANERLGRYIRRIIPPIFGNAIALAAADANSDGRMDLAVLMDDGNAYTISDVPGEGWVLGDLVRWDGLGELLAPDSNILLGDIDNNGALDVMLGSDRGSRVWLNTGQESYQALPASINGFVQDLSDMTGDGRLDLVGLDEEGQAYLWVNSGSKPYHWQILRPRAGQALGDQRINSFTIGGEMEIRAGLLYQKQPISSPIVHFGLGERDRADIVRIIWPNGDIQSEFELAADQSIFTPQRLKGSCPWLFTFDGEKMRFVTDFIWRSPLGLRINAQETAGVATTEDWVKISGDDLVPHDGAYDIRITAELWETHFFDHVSLLAVDHPVETEVFVDERFVFPPPEMKIHMTSPVRSAHRVLTDGGVDVTEFVSARDGRYLDFFGRGEYQGITRDHSIEIDLGDNVPAGTLKLVAFGWVRPTDSSINVAISQGEHAPPRGIRLEAPDRQGGWRVIHENLGFPAGKTKTVLFDLENAFVEGAPRKVRLSTNLEIYWDHIGWATSLLDEELRINSVPMQSASLRYRGFSEVRAADRSSPELPDYQQLAGTAPRWRDLEGYHTRFGPVEELLNIVDDRYVIMNAGDELRFQFEALPEPENGWRRDFVLIGDGWVKDGDYNTAFSKTVLPLPSHDSPDYNTPPTTLWEDPIYRKHAADWQKYHVRYVAGDRFQRNLVTRGD